MSSQAKRLAGAAACAFVLGITPVVLQGQGVELTPMIGYQVGGSLSSSATEWSIKPNLNWGATLGFDVRRGGQVELIFNRQDSQLELTDRQTGQKTEIAGTGTTYLQIGGLYEIVNSAPTRPFISLSVGATALNLKESELVASSTEWRFSGHFGGGLKYFLSDRVGLRGQGRLWLTFINASGGFWCGAPGGCAIGASGEVITQFEFSGGLIIAF